MEHTHSVRSRGIDTTLLTEQHASEESTSMHGYCNHPLSVSMIDSDQHNNTLYFTYGNINTAALNLLLHPVWYSRVYTWYAQGRSTSDELRADRLQIGVHIIRYAHHTMCNMEVTIDVLV
eukprot:14324-Heterococcus_DN1.PRE.1